ncbi:hypothetical protein SAMN05192544_100821 [Paraburkholderia hospita]|jgi:hypothetical protein|nr:hypothetical protein [Paraburkholderia hospita]SEH76969.1 hypothetical protein SAMN05192544_100821 [Paraburkholderia hospita]SKC97693.1 hypothetical protein SAMN05445504_7236 [Burkholderia sp. CF099]
MPFQEVAILDDNGGGNFPSEMRKYFNKCGRAYYKGSLKFTDAKHHARLVPIFHEECLEDDKPQTYALLQKVRKAMRLPGIPHQYNNMPDHRGELGARSIHQNEYGYLPYKNDAPAGRHSIGAPVIWHAATTVGALPNNQASANAVTRGQFMEYTCADGMHVNCRLVVDYRFSFVYMTFGHYHADSFALLIRSSTELNFEVLPTLPVLDASFVL